ncbi:MAG: SusD/RagB family nutrient-binding outer membrane lipoprotein, partial [Bacteroidales bacterium]
MKKTKKNIMRLRLLVSCLIGVLGLGLASCTQNFEEYNTNPDEPTDEMLEGDNFKIGAFFPQMQISVIPGGGGNPNQFQVSQNLTGDVYSGYMTGIGAWNNGKNGTTAAFVITDWQDIPFNRVLASSISADLNVKRQVGTDISNPVVAFSTILKVACVHRFADMFGPLPYTKIAEGGSLEIPYDSEEVLYKSFFQELTDAINTLTDYTKKNPGASPMADYDLVYDGDYVKWVKFANSLKLRMAMRCSYVDPTLAQTNAEEAVNHEYGVITENADNAELKSGKG